MTEETNNPANDQPTSENVSHAPVAARVPEKVARGIFCTGQVILDSPKEFVIDFLQGLTRPYQVISRGASGVLYFRWRQPRRGSGR